MKDHKKECAESYLSPDLVRDILSRLPVKSLIRFRCVCKPWRFLIDDANFAKEQHLRASPALISPCYMPRITFYDFSRPECHIKERMPQLKFQALAPCGSLSNSVNGLICGYTSSTFYKKKYCLLNPSTRTLVQLPRTNLSQEDCLISVGLGFDLSTGNYKLVLLSYTYVRRHSRSCFVLTVGCDDKWRYVGEAPSLFPTCRAVFVGGVISWISNLHMNGEMVILAFRMKDEKFHLISTPKSRLPTYESYPSNCSEHLWLVVRNEECLSVWKRDNYTSQKWTREYQIDFPLGSLPAYFFPGPVAIKDDKFVFKCSYLYINSKLANAMFFNKVRKSLKYYFTQLPAVALYTESLVCPRKLLGLLKEVV